ncbi:MAG: ATP-dependent RecD-like DNA helicase [bacterium]
MNTTTASSDREVLSVLIERVTFHNPDNGFCVLRTKVRGHRDLVTIVGHAAIISAGEYVSATGNWFNDRTHGPQFRAEYLRVTPPTGVEGIEKYLASGMVKGIGPVYAKRLVEAFGESVFDVIEEHPERLREVTGIGAIRADRIISAWADQKAIREIMVFLHQNGVSTSRAVRIYKTYGAEAIEVVSENPYRLAHDIRGIGFVTADKIASNVGIEKTSMIRARAGISYGLSKGMEQGHCGLPQDELIPLAEKLLEIPQSIIEQGLELEIEATELVRDTVSGRQCVFLAGLYRTEQAISKRIKSLSSGLPPWPDIDPDKAIPWVEKKLGIELADSQRKAVASALTSKVLVITGGPGVGKTTIVNSILRILRAKGVRIALCAPTGRAAKRLSESTGCEARTIHRLLEVDFASGGFQRNEDKPLGCSYLVADETSMVDLPLMNALLRAIPLNAAILFVGDVDQLPSVGPGQFLADLIESGAVPVARLTEIFRQAAGSRIVTNAHRINKGLMPEFATKDGHSDFYFIDLKTPEEGVSKLLQIVKDRIPARFGIDPVREIQVLSPMNRGGLGARSLNIELQKLLNPNAEPKVERFGWTFGAGDKVMQTENDYEKEVYNGDIGFIASIDPDTREVIIDFDGQRVTYDFDELDEVVPAYAVTIHKAQGSEYPAVVIPLTTQHFPMLNRNLIYTGVTRGKRLVVIVGQRKAMAIAVKGKQDRRRWSKLKEWLESSLSGDSGTR